jgi:hypothetical protein
MNRLWKTFRISALTLGVVLGSAGAASAQTGGGSGSGTGGGTSSGATGGTTTNARADNGFDWGWIGLLGLAGLIPLFTRRNGNGHTTHGGNMGRGNA